MTPQLLKKFISLPQSRLHALALHRLARCRREEDDLGVEQLTGGLAHDFNNLLTSIMGSLEMLDSRIAEGRSRDLERYIRIALGAGKRTAALTHRLLAFARRQTLGSRTIDISHYWIPCAELTF